MSTLQFEDRVRSVGAADEAARHAITFTVHSAIYWVAAADPTMARTLREALKRRTEVRVTVDVRTCEISAVAPAG